MSSEYIFKFTDTSKTSFAVFPYTADGPRSPSDPLLIDQAVRASTTLKFVGKGLPEYGEKIEQNLVYMLEHFAGGTAPVYSIEGQMWYKNSTAELFIRNGAGGWNALILATGSSRMTAPLLLSTTGDPGDGSLNQNYYAAPRGYVDGIKTDVYSHINNEQLHITNYQDAFLDGIETAGLTYQQASTLLGINTGTLVQTQLDDKISKTTSVSNIMGLNVDITFNGGNVIGLPLTAPVNPTAAVSRGYVDTLIATGATGDGYLSSTQWLPGTGTIDNINNNILALTVTYPDTSTSTLLVEGISRVGHTQPASTVLLSTGLLPSYPSNVQGAIEWIDSTKAPSASPSFSGTATFNGNVVMVGTNTVTGTLTLSQNPVNNYDAATKIYVDSLVGGGSTPSTSTTIQRALSVTPSITTIINVPNYVAGSNKLFLFANGIKQYGHTYEGKQSITFDASIASITSTTSTNLNVALNYSFNIAVDGGATTLITIPAGSSISTYGTLITTINGLLTLAGLSATISIADTNHLLFASNNSGSTATILVSAPPGGSPVPHYLFDVSAGNGIVRPEFTGNFTNPNPATWTTPDHLVVTGDVSLNYPSGTSFTVRGSVTDYGAYDAEYTVYITGATYNGGTNETWIPVAGAGTPAQPVPLLYAYESALGGSPLPPAPVITSAGTIYRSYLGALVSVNAPTIGMDGDYREVRAVGSPVTYVQAIPGTTTNLVAFNYDVPAGMRFEANVFN